MGSNPSAGRDISANSQFNITLCILAWTKTSCYIFKGTREVNEALGSTSDVTCSFFDRTLLFNYHIVITLKKPGIGKESFNNAV